MDLDPGTERPRGRQYLAAAIVIVLLGVLAYWLRVRGASG